MDLPRSDSLFPDTRWSIVLAAQGGSTQARRALADLCEVPVMDWGLAKMMKDEGGSTNAESLAPSSFRLAPSSFGETLQGSVLGTPHYMSPEQARGEVDALDERTDIFSLGGILYALLTLRPPVAGSTLDEVLANVRSGNIPAPATQQMQADDGKPAKFQPLRHVRGGRIPAALSAVAMKALASDPARRFPSVAAMATDVDAYLGGFATSAENAGAIARTWLFVKRHRALSLAAAAIVGLTAGFLLKVLASERRAKAHARAAETAAADARAREHETRITLADSFAQQGLRAGEDGRHGRAQLWFTLAAETAADDAARVALNRQRARLWGAESVRLTGVIPEGMHGVMEARFHPTGPWLMLAKADNDFGPGQRQLLHTKRLTVLPWGAGDDLVASAAFEPGTERVAVSRRPGEVKILRLGDLGVEATIALPGEPQPVRALAWSDDGRWLFIGARTARLWDARAQRLVDTVFPHEAAVALAQFSADGTRLLTATHSAGGRSAQSAVRVFAIPPEGVEAAPLFAPVPHQFWIDAMPPRFSADGQRFFTQPQLRRLVTRDASTGAVLRDTACHDSINAVFPDERRGTCIRGIVDLQTGQLVQRLEIGRAQISPDGATVLDGENALLRNAADLAPLRPFGDQFGVEFAGFSQDGSKAVTIEYQGPLRLWSLAQSPPWRYVAGVSGVPILSADSRWLVSGGTNDLEMNFGRTLSVQVHALATGAKAGPRLEPGGSVLHAAFSQDAATLALACSATPEYTPATYRLPDGRGGNVQFFDWRTGKRRGAIVPLPAAPLRVAAAPDGRTFAVYCANGDIVTLPADQSAPPAVIATIAGTDEPKGSIPPRAGLIFSQDGQSLLVRPSGWARSFTVIDWPARKVRGVLPAGSQLTDLAEYGGIVGLMRFGRIGGKEPSFWQLSDLKPAPTPIDYAFKDYAYFGRFSEDGQLFMMSGDMPDVRVWDWRTGRRAVPDLPHVNALADFVAGQPWIFSAGSVGGVSSARLWDRASGQLAAPSVPLPGGLIAVVEASADGRFLVAAAAGGGAGFYIFDIAAWVGRADPTHTDADLKDLAELNSFHRLEGSGLVRLSREEWLARWERLRTRHPDLFDFESTPAKGAGASADPPGRRWLAGSSGALTQAETLPSPTWRPTGAVSGVKVRKIEEPDAR